MYTQFHAIIPSDFPFENSVISFSQFLHLFLSMWSTDRAISIGKEIERWLYKRNGRPIVPKGIATTRVVPQEFLISIKFLELFNSSFRAASGCPGLLGDADEIVPELGDNESSENPRC